MWRNRIVYILSIVVTGIGFTVADNVFLLFVFFSLILTAAILAAGTARAAKKISLRCQSENICIVNKESSLYIYLTNKSRFPVSCVRAKAVCSNIMFGTKWERLLTLPSERGEQKFHIPYECVNCGQNRLSLAEEECLDLLGLFAFPIHTKQRKKTFPVSDYNQFVEFAVYPEFPAAHAEVPVRQGVHSDIFYDHRRKGTDVTDVFGIRDYQPGDATNSIHWKMTGKADKLMVKEFSGMSRFHTLVLFDLVRSSGGKKVADATLNKVVSHGHAISRDLAENGIGHHVGVLIDSALTEAEVGSAADITNFLEKLLSVKIQDEGNILDDFYSLGLWRGFTRVIVVTGIPYDVAGLMLAQVTELEIAVPPEQTR